MRRGGAGGLVCRLPSSAGSSWTFVLKSFDHAVRDDDESGDEQAAIDNPLGSENHRAQAFRAALSYGGQAALANWELGGGGDCQCSTAG